MVIIQVLSRITYWLSRLIAVEERTALTFAVQRYELFLKQTSKSANFQAFSTIFFSTMQRATILPFHRNVVPTKFFLFFCQPKAEMRSIFIAINSNTFTPRPHNFPIANPDSAYPLSDLQVHTSHAIRWFHSTCTAALRIACNSLS